MQVNRGISSWKEWSGPRIQDLVSVNNRLYAHTGGEIVQSIDGGESWKSVSVDAKTYAHKPIKAGQSHLHFSTESRLAIVRNILYVISPEESDLSVFPFVSRG